MDAKTSYGDGQSIEDVNYTVLVARRSGVEEVRMFCPKGLNPGVSCGVLIPDSFGKTGEPCPFFILGLS